MELDDLAKIVQDGHAQTQKKVDDLGKKVETISNNQIAIRTELDKSIVRKEDCYKSQNACRNAVYNRLRQDNQSIKQEIAASGQTVKEYLTSLIPKPAKKNGNGGNALSWKVLVPLVSAIVALAGALAYIVNNIMRLQ